MSEWASEWVSERSSTADPRLAKGRRTANLHLWVSQPSHVAFLTALPQGSRPSFVSLPYFIRCPQGFYTFTASNTGSKERLKTYWILPWAGERAQSIVFATHVWKPEFNSLNSCLKKKSKWYPLEIQKLEAGAVVKSPSQSSRGHRFNSQQLHVS